MTWATQRSVAVGVCLLAIVAAAYAVGRLLWATECNMVVSASCLIGAFFALKALLKLPWRWDGTIAERIVGAAILGYVVLATASEQFCWAGDANKILIGVVWLSPLTVGGMMLPCRDCWSAGFACWFVLFAGTAALTYSAWHFSSGVGLFVAWLA